MEEKKYEIHFHGHTQGVQIGDENTSAMHFSSSSSSPSSSYRSILSVPPLTDPRSIHQRKGLVESVIAQLKQPDLNALVLTGIGGIGKSTLAGLVYRYVQHHLSEGPFTADSLWLNIDATTTFADLMGSIYQILEKPLPDLKQLSPASQAQALFFTLSSAPIHLIVIDQCEVVLESKTGKALSDRPGLAEWFDAINSQLFETGCRLLFTSRQRPRGNRVDLPTFFQVVPVGGLSTQEGVELFRLRQVHATEIEMQQAVIFCNGHALSLALLVSLVQDYHMPLAHLLADVTLWEGDIATNLLDALFERLSSLERAVLCAFSIYRLPVSIEAVQTILEPKYQKQTHLALRTLLNQHLIQSAQDAAYQLHIIIARYAQKHFVKGDEQANQQALQDAHTKAAHYYKEVSARQAPPPEQRRSVKEVEPLLEVLWHLTQATQWEEAFESAINEQVFKTLDRCGGYGQLVEISQLFLTSTCWQGQPEEMAFLSFWQGNASRVLGRPQQALTCYEQALTIAQEVGNRAGEGIILNNLGLLYKQLGRETEALKYYKQALTIAQEVGNRAGEGILLSNLGSLYQDLGKQTEALEYYQQALAIHQEVGDRLEEGTTLSNLGVLYKGLGKLTEALQYYQQALVIAQEVGNRPGEGATLNNLGLFYQDLDKQTKALEYYKQALVIRQEVGDRLGEGVTLNNLGGLYDALGKQTEALAYYQQALHIAQEVSDRAGVGTTLNNLGGLYHGLGINDGV